MWKLQMAQMQTTLTPLSPSFLRRNDLLAMDGLQMPIRGGTRGGKDQFKWDDVKLDKHRENYLGHSLQVGIERVS